MPTNVKTRKRKLDTLIELLQQEDAQKTLNMGVWYRMAEEGRDSRQSFECGYAACALGQAALHPPFVAQGLGIKMMGQSGHIYYQPDATDCKCYHTVAGAEFFGLNLREAQFLFNPEEYYYESCFKSMIYAVENAEYDTDDYFLDEDEDTTNFKDIPMSMVIRRIEFVRDHPHKDKSESGVLYERRLK